MNAVDSALKAKPVDVALRLDLAIHHFTIGYVPKCGGRIVAGLKRHGLRHPHRNRTNRSTIAENQHPDLISRQCAIVEPHLVEGPLEDVVSRKRLADPPTDLPKITG